jgi:hypothetical protein
VQVKTLLLALCLLASPAWATPTYVKCAVGNGTVTAVTFTTATYTSSSQTKLLLVLHIADYTGGPPSAVSWRGQAFTARPSWPYSPSNWFGGSSWTLAIGDGTGASGELLIYYPSGTGYFAWTLVEYSGVSQSAPVGLTSYVTNSGSTSTNISLTPTAANSIISSSALFYTTATSLTSTTAGYTFLTQSASAVEFNRVYEAPATVPGIYALTYGFSATPNYGGAIMLEIRDAGLANQLSPAMWKGNTVEMFPTSRRGGR